MYSSNDKNDTFSQEVLETGRTLYFKTFSYGFADGQKLGKKH